MDYAPRTHMTREIITSILEGEGAEGSGGSFKIREEREATCFISAPGELMAIGRVVRVELKEHYVTLSTAKDERFAFAYRRRAGLQAGRARAGQRALGRLPVGSLARRGPLDRGALGERSVRSADLGAGSRQDSRDADRIPRPADAERAVIDRGAEGGYLIDIDQLAMVLFPLNLGNVGMRPRTQLANEPPF